MPLLALAIFQQLAAGDIVVGRVLLCAAALLASLGAVLDPAPARARPASETSPQAATVAAHVRVGPSAGPHFLPLHDPRAARALPAPAAAPHLSYYGGRVLSNVQVITVLYGPGSYLPQVAGTASPSLANFFGAILASPYIDWLTEYNTPAAGGTGQAIGHGTFAGQFAITPSPPNNGTTISDASIQSELRAQIAAGLLPAPTIDAQGNPLTLYAIHVPHGHSIVNGTMRSCVSGGFCAYHGTIAAGAQSEIYYAVHPDMQPGSGCDTGCGAGTNFQNETAVSSHELVEAITDAEVGLATVVGPPVAWYDASNGEIGDLCNAQHGIVTGTDGLAYTVQLEFSNRANGCIATTLPTDFSIAIAPGTLTVAPGASASATVTTAITQNTTQTIRLAASGLPAGLSASFSPASVSSGASSTLVLTAAAGTSPVTQAFSVTGTSATATHSVPASVSVALAPDFSLAIAPAAAAISPGSGANFLVNTATVQGPPQTVTLSLGGLAAGLTGSLSPASVTSGQSSTLVLSAAASVPLSSLPAAFTVTGTSGSTVHTASSAYLVIGNASTPAGEVPLPAWSLAALASALAFATARLARRPGGA